MVFAFIRVAPFFSFFFLAFFFLSNCQIKFKVADTAPLDFGGTSWRWACSSQQSKGTRDGRFLEIQDPVVASLDEALGG